jgi:hypothetical protein
VHPPLWRKPQSPRQVCKGFFDMMTKENKMIYLEIHTKEDGEKVFGAGTRYDWYIIQKTKPEIGYKIEIKTQDGDVEYLQVHNWCFIPNNNFRLAEKLLAKEGEEKCSVLDTNRVDFTGGFKEYEEQTEEYRYPVIHSTAKRSTRVYYTNTKDKGCFGIPKIIFGRTGLYNVIIDMDGEFGVSRNTAGIITDDPIEAKKMAEFLLKPAFTKLARTTFLWSLYGLDFNLFKYFKKDFYNQEIN